MTTPAPTDARASTLPLSSIGNILSMPYETDSEEEGEVILSFSTTKPTLHRLRSGDRRESVRNVPPSYFKSVEGEVIFHGVNSNEHLQQESQEKTTLRGRPPTIVDFPNPQIVVSPEPNWIPIPSNSKLSPKAPDTTGGWSIKYISPTHLVPTIPAYPSPTHPPLRSPGYPNSQLVPNGNGGLAPSRPQIYIPDGAPPGPEMTLILPPLTSPISPYLAAAPSPSSSKNLNIPPPGTVLTGPLASGRVSTASESIRGYDMMAEKKALFRGGEEEILNPWSSGRRREVKPSGLRNGKVMSTVDFWKRFSTVRLENARGKSGKESEWLEKQQRSRRGIKVWVLIGLGTLLIGIVALVVILVVRAQIDPSSDDDD